jgi:hypothetical protein
MRAAAGLLAFNGLLVVLGLGLLGAAGLLRLRLRTLVAAAPAGLVAGAAVACIGGVALLTAGGTLDLKVFTAGTVVLAAILWLIALWRIRRAADDVALDEATPVDARTVRMDRYLLWAVVAGVAAFVLVQAYSSRRVPAAWDASHNWMLKASALTTGGLEGDMFSDGRAFSAAHLDYPILQPVLGALTFRFAGAGRHGLLLVELWLLGGALALSGPWLAGRRFRAWLMILPLALALAAATSLGILRGDADVTVAIFLAAGALALGLWLDGGRGGLAVFAAVCLGAAVNTKNEGLAYSVAVLAAAAAVLALTDRRRLLPLAGVGVAVAAFTLPWRLWVSANGPFGSDVTPLSTSLDAGFLWDRLHRLDLAAQTVLGRLTDQGAHVWIVPLFLAVTVAVLVSGPRRRVPAFYLGSVLLAVAALLWVYWTTSQPDWLGHYQRTSLRTITGPLFVAAAALAHILPRAVDWPGALGTPATSTREAPGAVAATGPAAPRTASRDRV